MPEAAMDENHRSQTGENKVGRARQITSMQPETET
jgi:hypothetical protein